MHFIYRPRSLARASRLIITVMHRSRPAMRRT
jgi:hypothetical protein